MMVRLYPPDHPRDEMLGVLEERHRPWHREVPALLLGALRARTGGGHPATLRWLYAARAAALMLLVAGAVAPVQDLRYGVVLRSGLMDATWVCAGLAALAVVAGFRLVAFAFAASALVLAGTDLTSIPAIACYTVAAVLLLLPGPRLPVRNPLPVLLALAWSAGYPLPEGVQLALIVALALWTVVDERVLLAAGLALAAGLITAALEVAEVSDTRGLLILAAWHVGLPAVLVAVAGTLTRRRAQV